VWITGGWTFPDDGFSVSVHVGNDERPVETRPVVEDHRQEETTTYVAPPVQEERPKVQDHRDEPKKEERPKVQDHRDDKKKDEPKEERPKVRDHRR
jgi:hypothetical protein